MQIRLPIAAASLIATCLLLGAWSEALSVTSAYYEDDDAGKERALKSLSEYGFFEGSLSELRPADNVHVYALNTPLFSDYAVKDRFVYVPQDSVLEWRDEEVFRFPLGSVLIKTFSYPVDAREPSLGRLLVETRLLKLTERGWLAWGYQWNDDQTDASYKPLGGKTDVVWVDARGKTHTLRYEAPNQFECKSCHSYNGELRPIGPSARQLHNSSNSYVSSWTSSGLLAGAPSDVSTWPSMDWRADSNTPEASARAYLDANCGYCHRQEGPASTSGLFLARHYPTGAATGVRKSPVAAGKGSGGLKYDIAPGDPDASILLHRMVSTEPAVRMPEVGRSMVDAEGVALVKAWIAEME